MTRIENPATPGGEIGGDEPHTHPLPRPVRLALIAYALLFPVVFIALGGLLVQDRVSQDQQLQQIDHKLDQRVAGIYAELDRRSAARDAQRARDGQRINVTVCAVLAESARPSATTRTLQAQLHCPPR